MDDAERQAILEQTTVNGVLMATLPETRVMAVLSPAETVETTRAHAAEFHGTIGENVMADCCLAHECYDADGVLTHYCCEVTGSPEWIEHLWQYYQGNLHRATHTQYVDRPVLSVLEEHGLTSPSFELRQQQKAAALAQRRQEWREREIAEQAKAAEIRAARTAKRIAEAG